MSKTKRLLSVTLAIAMIILSAFSAFAEDTETVVETVGAMSVAAVSIETDDTTFDVNVKISFNKYVTGPHNIITLTCDNFNLTNVELGDVVYNYTSSEKVNGETVQLPQGKVTIAEDSVKNVNWATGKVLIEAPVDVNAPLVSEINLTATFTLKADVALVAGDTLNIAVANDDMADASETKLSISAGANVATVHGVGTAYGYDENGHWLKCAVEGCTDTTHNGTTEEHSFTESEDGLTESCICGYSRDVEEELKVDTNLTFSRYLVSLDKTIGFSLAFKVPSDYDSVTLKIERKTYNDVYDFIDAPVAEFDSSTMTAVSGTYYPAYSGIAMHEINTPVTAVLYGVKDGAVVACSEPLETSLSAILRDKLTGASNTLTNATYADILRVGSTAYQYFLASAIKTNPDADITTLEDPLKDFTLPDDLGNVINNTSAEVVNNASVTPYLGLSPVPCFTYLLKVPTGYSAEDLSVKATYTSNVSSNGTNGVVTKVADFTSLMVGSTYQLPYNDIAIYDGNKDVTVEIIYKAGTSDEAVIATGVASTEAFINAKLAGSVGTLTKNTYEAVLKLGTSARAYFTAYYKYEV